MGAIRGPGQPQDHCPISCSTSAKSSLRSASVRSKRKIATSRDTTQKPGASITCLGWVVLRLAETEVSIVKLRVDQKTPTAHYPAKARSADPPGYRLANTSPQKGPGGLLRRLAVASHAVVIHRRLRGLKIAVAPLFCFGITFLKCFISRHRHRRVGSRSRVRFRSLSFLRKGLRPGGNNNRGDYQKREGLHEKPPLRDLGASHLT